MKEVRLVEIEIHSKCNRKCSWCPNSTIDRDFLTIMSEWTYKKILNELAEHNYEGTISYSRYNEPMYDMELLRIRAKQAKLILPKARVVFNTNGDYLSKENLQDLEVDEITIMDYDCIGMSECEKRLKDAGVIITTGLYPYLMGYIDNKIKTKVLYYIDWPKQACIEDRGGSLPEFSKVKRTEPCYEPKFFIGIDYNGGVMPCCHLRSDNARQASFCLGNVNDGSLYNIIDNDKAMYFSSTMAHGNSDYYYIPCRNCLKGPGRYTREEPGITYK